MSRLDLDWIRGVAALAVLASHILLFYPVDGAPDWIQHAGRVGVEVFFVLSGFLISLSWATKPVLSDYLVRRAKRILPLMWVVMAVIFFVLTPIFLKWSLLDPRHWTVVLLHFLGLQSAIPVDIPGLFIGLPLWTLTIEICFYLVLPFWWKSFARNPAAWVVASLAIEVLWRAWAGSFVSSNGLSEQWALYLPLQLPGQAFGFSVGMLLAWMLLQARSRERSKVEFARGMLADAGVALPPITAAPVCRAEDRLVHFDTVGCDGVFHSTTMVVSPWAHFGVHETFLRRLVRHAGRILLIWPEDVPAWLGIRVGLIGLFAGTVFFGVLWESGASMLVFPFLAGLLIWSSSVLRSEPGVICHAMGFIGQVSYSIYLWHFPILFVLSRTTDMSFIWFAISGCLLSVLAAFLSFRFIEKLF